MTPEARSILESLPMSREAFLTAYGAQKLDGLVLSGAVSVLDGVVTLAELGRQRLEPSWP